MNNREGFTLVEVLVAMVILAIAVTSAQALITDRLVSTVGKEGKMATAKELAGSQVERVHTDPEYGQLEARYHNKTEKDPEGFVGFTRTTWVVLNKDKSKTGDFKTVTVKVWHNALRDTVARTTVVAAP